MMPAELRNKVTIDRSTIESKNLCQFACLSKSAMRKSDAEGRRSGELPDYRSPFAHDADRIMHSHSYARYMDKTQVFFQIKNDHITRRSLHVQMVSRIARTIGRCLKLNEDLVEAIAIGHDIGHTPFGHAGESILNAILQEKNAGAFVHNAQSVRVMQELEHKGRGCDLTIQVLDGILGHNGELAQPTFNFDSANLTWDVLKSNVDACFQTPGYDKKISPSTLEGCVVRVSDMISYVGKDFEDAVILGLINKDDLPLDIRRVLGSTNHDIINVLCADIIENSYDKEAIAFSDPIFYAFSLLKDFNYKYIYGCTLIDEQKKRFEKMVRELFDLYLGDLQKGDSEASIFHDYVSRFPDTYLSNTRNERIVADFIAGMTDQYFLKQYQLRCLPRKIDYDEVALIKTLSGKRV